MIVISRTDMALMNEESLGGKERKKARKTLLTIRTISLPEPSLIPVRSSEALETIGDVRREFIITAELYMRV